MVTKTPGLRIGRVIYDDEVKTRLINRIIDAILSSESDYEEYGEEKFINAFVVHFNALSYFMKSAFFREENEWRLIYIIEAGKEQEIVKHRIGELGLVPFYDLEIPHFDESILEVITGPKLDYSLNRIAIANFIGENNILDGKIVAIENEQCTVTLDSGESVRARSVHIAGVGDRTSLSIRPERLLLTPGGSESGMHGNRLRATVEEIVYGGDHSMIRLTRPAGDKLVAKLVAAEAETIGLGDDLEIGWQPSHCRALDPR